MISNRKNCINVPTSFYTGKESSPLRFGLSAEGYDIGYDMEGHDKLLWTVKVKNNKKVWGRKYDYEKVLHEEPLIKEEEKLQPVVVVKEEIQVIAEEVVEKKQTTDYNLFLSYYLNKLKAENTTNETNKNLFSKTTEEWKRLKKNPEELRNILQKIKSNK
jgi:hypothetical protein